MLYLGNTLIPSAFYDNKYLLGAYYQNQWYPIYMKKINVSYLKEFDLVDKENLTTFNLMVNVDTNAYSEKLADVTDFDCIYKAYLVDTTLDNEVPKKSKYSIITNVSDYYLPSSVNAMFYNCQNLVSVNLRYPKNPLSPITTEFITDTSEMFFNCINLTDIDWEPMENLVNMDYMFTNCTSFNNAICYDKVQSMRYTYAYCHNLIKANVSDSVTDMTGAYMYCSNLAEAAIGKSVTDMSSAFIRCRDLNEPVINDKVTDMSSAYLDCIKLTYAISGPNVTNMYSTYRGCSNLLEAACGDNTIDLARCYQNCTSLITPACGDNVVNLNSTYSGCVNLTTALCTDLVTDMDNSYTKCYSITEPVCGPNVINMQNAYNSCTGLNTIAACGDNVINMSHAYALCTNLSTPYIGPNVTDASYAFDRCYRLKGDIRLPNHYINLYGCFNNLAVTDVNLYISNEQTWTDIYTDPSYLLGIDDSSWSEDEINGGYYLNTTEQYINRFHIYKDF
jgi:hypothetical protein